jgi:MOSC domain-containing protein YiiM
VSGAADRAGRGAGPARIVGLQRSPGGVPKLPVERAAVTATGMEGDRQRNRRFHGGPTRALCLYSSERIEALVAEGHRVVPGALGENVTIAGLDWALVQPGASLALGDAVVKVTSFTAPCRNIAHPFHDGDFMRVSQKAHPGWSRVYVRVVQGGVLSLGDPVSFLERA